MSVDVMAAWDPWPWLLPVDGPGLRAPPPPLQLHAPTPRHVDEFGSTSTGIDGHTDCGFAQNFHVDEDPDPWLNGFGYNAWSDNAGVCAISDDFSLQAACVQEIESLMDFTMEGYCGVENPLNWAFEAETDTQIEATLGVAMLLEEGYDGEAEPWSQPEANPWSQCDQAPSRPAMLVLRGLPFSAKETEVTALVAKVGVSTSLSKCGIGQRRPSIRIIEDSMGRPSGFCVLEIAEPSQLHEVRRKLHMQRLGGRYIEALLPESCERWVASAIANWMY
jgi:hypothetical protein